MAVSGGIDPTGELLFRAQRFWEHPTFFDARDELQVKYEMLRARFVDGQTVTAVCDVFSYSRQTFNILRQRYARRGIAGLRDGRPGRVGPVKCTPDVVEFLFGRLSWPEAAGALPLFALPPG